MFRLNLKIKQRTGVALWALLLFVISTAAENRCQAGYWIVSTYSIAQQPGSCPKNLNFKYYYKPNKGKLKSICGAQMIQSLNPAAPTCIFIHGTNVAIDVAIKDANNTYGWLKNGMPNQPFNLIMLAWPSNEIHTGLPTVDITREGLRATQNGIYLAHLMDKIPCSSPISLLGHSHGTRTIAAGLHYRGGGQIFGLYKQTASCNKRKIRVVFAAAAINHTWLNPNNRYGKAMSQIDSLLNIINQRDLALTVYPLVTPAYGRALAKTGITRFDKRQLGSNAHKIHELDATTVIGFRHTWPNYYGRPELARMIAPYLFCNSGCPNHSQNHANFNRKKISSMANRNSMNSKSAEIILPEMSSALGESTSRSVNAISSNRVHAPEAIVGSVTTK